MLNIETFRNVGYRRQGGGGPSRTLLYDWITRRPTVAQLYSALYRANLHHACQLLQERGLVHDNAACANGQMYQYSGNQGQTYQGVLHQGQAYAGQMAQGQMYYPGEAPQGHMQYQGQMSQPQGCYQGQMPQAQMYYPGRIYPAGQVNKEQISPGQNAQGTAYPESQGIPLPTPPPESDFMPSFLSPKLVCSDVNLNSVRNNEPKSWESDKAKSLSTLASCSKPQSVCPSIDTGGRLERSQALLDAIGFPWGDIKDGTNNFSQDNIIGEGGFGIVYRVNLRKTNFAVKVLKDFDRPDEEQETIESNLTEISALFRYRHQNIIGLIGYSVYSPKTCIVYEFMVNGSLEDRLQCKDGTAPLAWEIRHRVMMGAACGLQYLHTAQAKPLIHGDVKSANILLDQNMEAKLSDFGQARQATGSGATTDTTQKDLEASPIYGTRAYLPIDFFNSMKLTISTDTFGYGVVLFEVCTAQKANDPNRGQADCFLRDYVQNLFNSPSGMDALVKERDEKASDWPIALYTKMMELGLQCIKRRKKERPEMTKVLTTLEMLEGESQIAKIAQNAAGWRLPPQGSSDNGGSLCSAKSSTPRSYHIDYESNLEQPADKMLGMPSLQPPSSLGSSKSYGTLDSQLDGESYEPGSADDPLFSVCDSAKLTHSEQLRESNLKQDYMVQCMDQLSINSSRPPLTSTSINPQMSVPLAMQLVYDSGGKIPTDSLLDSGHMAHVLQIKKKSFPFQTNPCPENCPVSGLEVGAYPPLYAARVGYETRSGAEGVDQPECGGETNDISKYHQVRAKLAPLVKQFIAGPADTVRPPSTYGTTSGLAVGGHTAVGTSGGTLGEMSTCQSYECSQMFHGNNPIMYPDLEVPVSVPIDEITSIDMYGAGEVNTELFQPVHGSASGMISECAETSHKPEPEDQDRLDRSLQLTQRHRKLKEPQEG